ncbi:thiosulfate oxidation carrier complex protein SoxZ [Sphaerotilus sulfidivorans]|nr:hypothetical protein CQA4T8M7_27220 [Sphaerotilus natans]
MAEPLPTSPQPMRLRALRQGERVVVRVLMSHEMENGRRHDEAGRLVPAWHIREVVARLDGRVVLQAHWGPSVSRHPYLQFVLRAAAAPAGSRLSVTWTDSRGEQRSDETLIG